MFTIPFLCGCGEAPAPALTVIPEVSRGIPFDALKRLAKVASGSPEMAVSFHQAAEDLGLEFTYFNGNRGHRLMSEATGGGCGWIDYDRDGLADLYLVQGGVADAAPEAVQPLDQLFRNTGSAFRNVTESSMISEPGYGQGVAVGDFDGDGFTDLLVTNVGPNTLWHNEGDGTFQEVGGWDAGSEVYWSSSAAWADIDGDGDLDLYVCNYCDFHPRRPVICRNESGDQVQCQPNQVPPVPDQCFLNLGDGRFEEASQRLGLFGEGNRALGVVIADLRGDPQPEIYVANDATANFLFVRQPEGRYADQATQFGCAVDANGRAQASMGIAVGDYDRNGFLDLYLTHFTGEWNTLYANFGARGFEDVTGAMGIVECTLPWVGFGTVMEDFDQDSRDEIFVANGHIDDLGRKQVLAMPPQLLAFDGGRWHEVSERCGDYFHRRLVGRGSAEADLDNDGDFDLAVVHQNTPTEILRNDSRRGHWLAFEFVGTRSNRSGIGARVTVTGEGSRQMQELIGGGSYCSSRQPRLIFGLGDRSTCDVEVRWPSGTVQTLRGVTADRLRILIEPQS